MSLTYSPLRYPGGKSSFTDFFGRLLRENGLEGGLYAEPFAGGAGAALGLLVEGYVDRIAINDADPSIFAFWDSAINNTKRFIDLISTVPLNVEEWNRQRQIYLNPQKNSRLALGFAAFYLNRCNRSGIMMNGGPIGGKLQAGKWKLDARFNRERLAERIATVADYKDRITLHCEDAVGFIGKIPALQGKDHCLVFIDPPYYVKGAQLYMNSLTHEDHLRLKNEIIKPWNFTWIMTYDDVPQIRELYSWAKCQKFLLQYTAYKERSGGEVLITPTNLKLPALDGSAKFREISHGDHPALRPRDRPQAGRVGGI